MMTGDIPMTQEIPIYADDFHITICQGTFQDLLVFGVDLLIGQGPRHVSPGDAEHLRGAAWGGHGGDGAIISSVHPLRFQSEYQHVPTKNCFFAGDLRLAAKVFKAS